MVSDASKKKAAQKKAAAAAKRGGKAAAAAASSKTAEAQNVGGVDKVADGIGAIQISDRTCTGVLCSHPLSRDIRVSFYLFVLDINRISEEINFLFEFNLCSNFRYYTLFMFYPFFFLKKIGDDFLVSFENI